MPAFAILVFRAQHVQPRGRGVLTFVRRWKRAQWTSYYHADRARLSRLYGGTHPRVDDFIGRIVGSQVGTTAFAKAQTYFDGTAAP